VLGLAVYLPLFLQGVLGVSATSAGAAITPLSLAEVVGAALAGLVILTRKRYQAVTILGACIMTLGTFLLTRVTVSTTLLNAVIYMVIAGVGMGMFFPVLTLAAQNALPHSRLGVGTATVRYLGQLGAVLGIAIVGAVVSSSLSSDIVTRLPPDTVQQLTLHGLEVATNPQVLVNPAYRDTAMQIAEGYARQAAVARAVANVPPGPSHDQTAAAIASQVAAQATQQAQQVLSQVFDVLRLSLAVGIQRGFTAVLLFCGASIVATLFLKDVPMAAQFSAAPDEAGEETRSTTF
jgi:MFS family permease